MGVTIGDARYEFEWSNYSLTAGEREKIEVGQYGDVDINFCFSQPVGFVSYRGKDSGKETYRLECRSTGTRLYRIGSTWAARVLLGNGRALAPDEMAQIRLRGTQHSVVKVDVANTVTETIVPALTDGTYGATDPDPNMPGNLDGRGLRLFIGCLAASLSSMGHFVPR